MRGDKNPPPIVVGSFSCESDVKSALQELVAAGIGPDLIGIKYGVEGMNNDLRSGKVHLVSVFVPRRLRDGAMSILRNCGALMVEDYSGLGALKVHVPHPGTVEDHDMKLPLGLEYPANISRRKKTEG